MNESDYELFRSKWYVTEWRGGAVYRTHFVETDWFDLHSVQHPRTAETSILYSPPCDPGDPDFDSKMTIEELRGIRKKKA